MRHCCIAPSFPNFSKNAHLKAKIRQHPFLSRSVEYENILFLQRTQVGPTYDTARKAPI